MYTYYAKQIKDSNSVSDRYMYINNFGYTVDAQGLNVVRPQGRRDYQLIYVKSGRLLLDGGRDELNAGEVYLFRPCEAQVYSAVDAGTEFCWIHFTGAVVAEMLAFFEKSKYAVGTMQEFERFCHGYFGTLEDEQMYTELFYEGELIALIARIAERISSAEREGLNKIRPALELMRAQCHIRRSNSELAELCGMSKYYFMKLFKSVTGTSPQQYYTSLIVERGEYLLVNTGFAVSEIARMLGIDDAFYFSRMFKKHCGVAPLEYRRKNLY